MDVENGPIEGMRIMHPQVFGDDRGFFYESFNADKLAPYGIPSTFLQDNHSRSAKGVLRGLHFQLPPKAMAKIVRCVRGRMFDVGIDLRKNSPTFKRHFGIELSEANKTMVFWPEGIAHGFYALEDCELLYKSTNTFDKTLDANVAWNDPAFSIAWPIDGVPALSVRDAAAPTFSAIGFQF